MPRKNHWVCFRGVGMVTSPAGVFSIVHGSMPSVVSPPPPSWKLGRRLTRGPSRRPRAPSPTARVARHTLGISKANTVSPSAAADRIAQTLEVGVIRVRQQSASTASSARGQSWPERHGMNDVAGGAFCHAELRVCANRLAAARDTNAIFGLKPRLRSARRTLRT
jgi:hypothetical protein